KLQENGIMIRRYSRGLFQQDRSEADITRLLSNVCFTPQSGHRALTRLFASRQSRPNVPHQKSAWFTWRIEWRQRPARSARSTTPRARTQHAAGNLDNRHVGIVCAASAHVNVSVLYQFVDTAKPRWPTSVAPRRLLLRSGSAWPGRSQKDGLPSARGES